MPLWLLMSGLIWEKLQPYKIVFASLLVCLIGYNLICSSYVGWRFLDDPRFQAETWVQNNMPANSTVEEDVYSPTWTYLPNIHPVETVMPFVTGRERLFEVLFPNNEFINGTEADQKKADLDVAWFTEAQLYERHPDYVVIDSLYYERFTESGIRRDLYPSMYAYFDSLLNEQYSYRIVFDQQSYDVPGWVYPQDIDFLHNRVTILASEQGQANK
jgi:hypothetical protein